MLDDARAAAAGLTARPHSRSIPVDMQWLHSCDTSMKYFGLVNTIQYDSPFYVAIDGGRRAGGGRTVTRASLLPHGGGKRHQRTRCHHSYGLTFELQTPHCQPKLSESKLDNLDYSQSDHSLGRLIPVLYCHSQPTSSSSDRQPRKRQPEGLLSRPRRLTTAIIVFGRKAHLEYTAFSPTQDVDGGAEETDARF